VRHPVLNDRELSESLSVKVSTVTAIRRRLRRAEYFATRRIPMMGRLGWELFIGGRARLDLGPGSQPGPRLRELLKDRLPSLFHVVATSDHLTFLAFARNYTAARRDIDELRLGLDRAHLLGNGDVRFSALPLSVSAGPAFFDFSHTLALAFGIEDRVSLRVDHPKTGDINLTRKETEVLKGLVRFPELSDKALAQRVKVSRQAVSKMRHEFEAEGLLRTARIPNLRLLGFELYVSAFAQFGPSSTTKSRTEAYEHVLRLSPTYLLVSDDAEVVVLGASRSYEEFSVHRGFLTRQFGERTRLNGEPEIYVGLASGVEVLRNCDFGPLVQDLTTPTVPR
jgi:DNA-binding Lrp family transcriptional regulator